MSGAELLLKVLVGAHSCLDRRGEPPAGPHEPWLRWRRGQGEVRRYRYLTPTGREEAIRRAAAGETYSAIARSLDVSHTTIRRAVLDLNQRKEPAA